MSSIHESTQPGFILSDNTAQDVARAMIEGGKQLQPFHIFDLDEAYRRIQHFKKLMPKVHICYAVKSNDYEMLLKLALSQGLGFDCASPGEIYRVLELGANPRNIVYAIPSKLPSEMMFAAKAGVMHTTFDTAFELKRIKQYWPDASLLIRIRVDSDAKYKLGEKFGCDFDTEATGLLDYAADLGLRVAGVAFHVGSGCFSPESYEIGLRFAHALFEHEKRAGRQMSIVDIGGGFLADRIDKVASVINETLEELFPSCSDVQVIAEPGRYISESSMTLYCNINNTRKIKEGNKTITRLFINDGIFGTLRSCEPWHKVRKYKFTSRIEEEEDWEEVILFGPSGDSDDQVLKDRQIFLPRCSPSDWLVFEDQGSYTTNFATKFSCLPIPLIRPVVSLELWKKLEASAVFSSDDFVLDPDISSPLPSTLPSLPNLKNPSLLVKSFSLKN